MVLSGAAIVGLAQNQAFLYLLIGATGAALAIFLALGALLRKEQKVRVGRLSKLLIYPLKSARAVSVDLAECHPMGLKSGELRDRHWLVVTEDGRMVVGMREPRLVLVSLTVEAAHVCLRAPDMDELRVPFAQPENPVLDCRVFGDHVQGRDCGQEAADWLNTFLAGRNAYRLVHFELHMETRKSARTEALFPEHEEVAYVYAGPLMLLSDASLEDLRARTQEDLTAERFRPNLVVSGCKAFDEDSWDELLIGEVRLQRVMSCARCASTTIDPDTGALNRKEPLNTLKGYRQCDPSDRKIYKAAPLFGQYLIVKKTGQLRIGDVVYRISR